MSKKMSVFEDNTGLRDSQQPNFNKFQTELSPYFQTLQKIPVSVLIWGPGEGTKFYPKRIAIRDELRKNNPNNEVATSEELIKVIVHPKVVDIVQLEMLHAKVADVILGLITSDPMQTGIHMEISTLLAYPSLVDKTWLIIPKGWEKSAKGLMQIPVVNSFPGYRKKEFSMKALEQCNQVRAFCIDKVNEARSRIARHIIQDMLSD
jgi:hypothetical protein